MEIIQVGEESRKAIDDAPEEVYIIRRTSVSVPDIDSGREYRKAIDDARIDLRVLIEEKNCASLMLVLAWHDAATFDQATQTGGANGSIRNEIELNYKCNNGLKPAMNLCEEIKLKHPVISYADIIQLAGVIAVEIMCGPIIDFVPGRKDSSISPKEGRLPNPKKGNLHLRKVLRPMGFYSWEIVCLLGVYNMGKAHVDRSGSHGSTTDTLEFNNSYFKELVNGQSKGHLKLPVDRALMEDPGFCNHVHVYAEDEEVFVKQYAVSHKKLSELGFLEFGRSLPDPPKKNSVLVYTSVGVVAVVAAVMLVCYISQKRRQEF